MSWLARSIANTLSSNQSDTKSDEATSQQQPETPTGGDGGVKNDLSELTETITRRFWNVASFLAPPPDAEDKNDGHHEDEEEKGENSSDSTRIAGIRHDLAEIGVRVKSGISMLSNANAVAEISKIAASILPFGNDDEDDEVVPVVGVTEELVVFVEHVAGQPETWLHFPLVDEHRISDDFELTNAQYRHALAIERLVPRLKALRTELCPNHMSEGCFWKIYFVLLHSELDKQDAELLSTPQIMEIRAMLLQDSAAKKEMASEIFEDPVTKQTIPSALPDKIIEPSTIQNEASVSDVPPFLEQITTDVVRDIETEKHTVQTAKVEVVDKAVIEEQLKTSNDSKNLPVEKPKVYTEKDDDEVEEWLEEGTGEMVITTGNVVPLGQEEDVSFSDLEDDDDDAGAKQPSKVKASS